MILLNYLKNTFKNKNIKAIIYFIASYILNMAIFWLIYGKLLKKPNVMLCGTIAYIICFFIFSTPIINSINKILVEKPYIKNNGFFPKTVRAFENVKSEYLASGNNFAKKIKLCIYDEKYFQNTIDIIPYGKSEFAVNALSELLPEETNIGRFASAMDMVAFGYGMPKVVVGAVNPFYLIITTLFSAIFTVSSSIYGRVGLGVLERLGYLENQIVSKVLSQWLLLGNKLCQLKLNSNFFGAFGNTPFYEEKMQYFSMLFGDE